MGDVYQDSINGGGDHIVKSVARTCQTLVYFDDVRRPLSVVEVSKKLGYPRTVMRLSMCNWSGPRNHRSIMFLWARAVRWETRALGGF